MVELPSGEVVLPMLVLLSVFWSCRETTNAKNFVEVLDCYPKGRPAARISAVLSNKKGTNRSGSWLLIQKLGTDGKDNRIARGLRPVNVQPEKPLHVSRAQIAVGPATVVKLSSTHLHPKHARCTNIESDKTTSIHKVLTEAVSSLKLATEPAL